MGWPFWVRILACSIGRREWGGQGEAPHGPFLNSSASTLNAPCLTLRLGVLSAWSRMKKDFRSERATNYLGISFLICKMEPLRPTPHCCNRENNVSR